ncbi:hypothetical protein OJF2_08670 [Aquisphaera giovannonii]|uniref:Phage holin family protein n=1 Tax=Aquisphaera giovannonii TaxID=406548 RepID=A0A5B9VWS3_9BACT|nr:phage holin family protein [Aquisphaera giovannonii]QEH32397.1 hypothetical protein OJF2_08670 [Aquisphaera giovannonii]
MTEVGPEGRAEGEEATPVAERDLKTAAGEAAELAGLIARDAGRLLDQHGRLIRGEIRRGVRSAVPGVAMVGAGAGLAAVGGGLGALMVVHALNRFTRIPLWGCYALVGGAAATAGAGLMAGGARRIGAIDLVPRRTLGALKEDVSWIKSRLIQPPS